MRSQGLNIKSEGPKLAIIGHQAPGGAMHAVRSPAVAGLFYPRDPRALRAQIQGFLADVTTPLPPPKALIAPHAGYVYSGAVAASAYATIQALRQQTTRVILLGPAHRVFVRGFGASSAAFFETPLGQVHVDQSVIQSLVTDLPFVDYVDDAHSEEHSLEVQIPFLQETLDAFTLVPLVAGDASTEQVEAVLERLWGGPETLIVISSDLSHYHDYTTAKRIDRATTQAIERLEPAQITDVRACGRVPVRGLLTIAKRYGLSVHTVDVRNSGDTAGPRDRVVGYGAYLFYADNGL